MPAGDVTRHRPAGVTLRWFDTAGWEFAFDHHVVLVDPWLTRFQSTDSDGLFDMATPITADHALLDEHIPAMDLLLVTHGHFDHIGDVPYLAGKFPKAQVVGTESHAHLLSAMGVPEESMIQTSGGEYLDFGDYQVRVVRSLHSLNDKHRYIAPGTLTARPRTPRTIGELVEGGTLAYQLSAAGLNILVLGTGNCVERELAGLRPDVAIIALPPCPTTHRYLERTLEALDGPRFVLPNHHDEMAYPLGTSVIDKEAMAWFRRTVATVSPGSEVIEPTHLTPIEL
ncbi:MBL fold metallo-hydrolase [Actinocrispum wychmicini]|uniref:L-ascorbate metabolism protein UlaG (Beta-lactamase superfamily) n=1 Tax=Actinocrispum wychmicini TaxID=1213861 RepID=A0A4R2JUM6_9PSEU|nr:MBL fold metallo-hydrolase [Actinocrispum wychmicini]TCO62907.1 L-ascorbate metabolism protein UlaG (beta-lactamase superfamily) [Actinocrispum wychmicini]